MNKKDYTEETDISKKEPNETIQSDEENILQYSQIKGSNVSAWNQPVKVIKDND